MVGPGRLELPTPRLSSVCSNQLSYGPIQSNRSCGYCLFEERETWTAICAIPSGSEDLHGVLRCDGHLTGAIYCSKKHGKVHPLGKSKTCRRASYQFHSFLRKEVIQPQVPLRLPCYDFTPVADPTVVSCLPCGLAHYLRVKPTPMV